MTKQKWQLWARQPEIHDPGTLPLTRLPTKCVLATLSPDMESPFNAEVKIVRNFIFVSISDFYLYIRLRGVMLRDWNKFISRVVFDYLYRIMQVDLIIHITVVQHPVALFLLFSRVYFRLPCNSL
jgi:hypothetical protein